MKRTASLVAILLVACMLATPALAAEKLRVVGSWSSLTLYKNLEQPFWTTTLPEAMDGKVETIMTSLDQINIKGAAVLRQMQNGVFDVVHTVVDYVVSDCPELAGLDLPALAPDLETARKVVDAYWPVMELALENTFNAKLLALTPYPAQILFSNVEISGLADLKSKKIRASGWTTAAFLEALGAAGVTISFSEVPQSLQRGVVEGAVTGSLSGYNAGWGEVTSYLYPLPIGGWDYVMTVISLDRWNQFSAEEQAQIEKLVKDKLETPGWAVTNEETNMGIYCLTGMEECTCGDPADLNLVEVQPGDFELSRKILVETVLPAFAEEAGAEAAERWNNSIGKVVDLQAK